jgi:chemotaxis protein CheX
MIPSSPALRPGVDRDSWAPLLQLAAEEVFECMLGCRLTSPPEPVSADGLSVSSMVGLAGQLCGVITVRCRPKAVALMAAKMLGIDASHAGPEMWDAVGEVCNMVAGNFKNKIGALGDACMLSVPTVITGSDYSLYALSDSSAVSVRLLFDGDPILFSLELHS